MVNKKVLIVYYSGTGGTERVAKCFETAFSQVGYEVTTERLFQDRPCPLNEESLVVVIYAVHACNAPEPVYKWIDHLEKVNNRKAVVISVSGGGEVIPNTACRVSTIKKLEKKGFQVTYEEMLVMPSNWIVTNQLALSKKLIEVLPDKVANIVQNIKASKIKRTKPLVIDRLFSKMGEMEKSGAKMFGKHIKVSQSCTGCGWCQAHCPAGNITMVNHRPVFDGKCHLCLSCIYGCPQKALTPKFGKFVVVKEGFDLKRVELAQTTDLAPLDLEKVAKGAIWSGVRKYLKKD